MTGSEVLGPSGALEGVRVLDLTTIVMGPYATQLLGDLGADVIKVETGVGDGNRVMGGGPHRELSGMALSMHRNKRSIGIDLKDEEGRQVFLRLLDAADVFVTNLRPGTLGRLGIDYQSVGAMRERLVYCQAQGFRSDTDEADLPAYDDIIQALTGIPRLNEAVLGRTAFMPTILADKLAGVMIAYGALAALVHRERTGRGQRVEVPMFDAVLGFNLVEHLGRAVTPGESTGYSRIMTSNRGPHRTTDGYIAMMPYTDKHWRTLFAAIGEEERLRQPWFEDHRARLVNADQVYAELAEIVAARSTVAWLELCGREGIPAAEVPTLDQIVEDPARHRGVIREVDHPIVGRHREVGPPVVMSETPMRNRRPAPIVAQNTEEILREAGYTDPEIAALAEGGIVKVRRRRAQRPGTGDR
jgi:crotonobetainyl-CoA:carnitine CoA-transferase CaiB-like acyl-CoA transferase